MPKPIYRHASMKTSENAIDKYEKINAPLEFMIHGDESDQWKSNGVLDRINRIITGYNPPMCLHGPVFSFDPATKDKVISELNYKRVMNIFEIADLVKPEVIVFHSSYVDQIHRFEKERFRDATISFWQKAIVNLPNDTTRIAIENIFEFEPELLAETINEIDSERVGHCFDIGHFNMFQKGFKADRWLSAFGDKLTHLHIHDNFGAEDLHLAAGDGEIDFEPLIESLKKTKEPWSVTTEGKNYEDNEKSAGFIAHNFPGEFLTDTKTDK